MADGFLSRWSRAKTIDRSIREQGEARGPSTGEVGDQADPLAAEGLAPAPLDESTQQRSASMAAEGVEPQQPVPSMEDAKALSVGDDVSRFMGAHVAAEVRSLALRKLFALPHYNVRSDMDVYSEDFFNMPKLTAAEVANLQQSESLSLFEDPPWRKEMLQEEADQRAADAAAGIDQEATQQTTQETPVLDEPDPENLASEEHMQHDDVEAKQEGLLASAPSSRPEHTGTQGQGGEAIS